MGNSLTVRLSLQFICLKVELLDDEAKIDKDFRERAP